MNEVLVEQSGRVATVILDRPPVNALTQAVYVRLIEVFRDLGAGNEVHCVVLTGRGSTFCTGRDVQERIATSAEEDPRRSVIVRNAFRTVRTCAIPVVCAVNGPALGGGAMLASVCDIRIASDRASFGMNQIDLGRCGGGAYMSRHLSPGRLRRMYFTGEPVSAAEALQLGLADEVVPHEELLRSAGALAAKIASKNPVGLRMAKEALNQVEFMQVDDGYELEQQYSTQLLHTEDAREAMHAFAEGRPPVFKGR